MYFVGQQHIMKQLQLMLPTIYTDKIPVTFLFRGPSGFGKTHLALKICNYLTGGNFEYTLGDSFRFNPGILVHFIDEVHLLNPPEVIYPIIDSKKFVIILATNDAALLPEALVNRCTEFIFTDYSVEELEHMATEFITFKIPKENLDYLIECASKNPRILRGLCERLNIIGKTRRDLLVEPIQSFKKLMAEIFGIEDGLDVASRRYVETLEKVGGRASLDTLSTLLHIDKNTIRYFIEPALLYRNLITISSKGRILCQTQ